MKKGFFLRRLTPLLPQFHPYSCSSIVEPHIHFFSAKTQQKWKDSRVGEWRNNMKKKRLLLLLLNLLAESEYGWWEKKDENSSLMCFGGVRAEKESRKM
jgi:hypothetical protein